MALWNTEGQRSIMSVVTENALKEYEVLVLTETLAGRYSTHSPATQNAEGRPSGGVTCYISPRIGQRILDHTEENMKTNALTVAGLYFRPQTDILQIIDTAMDVIKYTVPEDPIIIAGISTAD